MNTSLTLSQDELAIMQNDQQKMGNRFPTIPQIRLSNTDMKQAPEGEYFIQRGYGEDAEIETIGSYPEIVILYRTYTYSYSTKEDGLIAWTSDIHGFGALDNVTLYKKTNGKVDIEFDGSYTDFKILKDKKYSVVDPMTGKSKSVLKFKTVLYVSYLGQCYKMFVSNASSSGVDHEGKLAFENPKEKSLQVFFNSLWKDKKISYQYKVQLGSELIKSSKPYYIMTFSVLGEQAIEDLKTSIRMSQDAQKAILIIDNARKDYNKKESTDPIKVIAHESEIDPADLPF